MKPGKPLRKSWLRRGTKPIPKRNAKRKAANLERAHGSRERRQWMKAQPCAVCGRTPCDAAHVKSGGTGRKENAALTVPLCSDQPGYIGHHAEYDGRKQAGGKKTFEKKYNVSMIELAHAWDAAWKRIAA